MCEPSWKASLLGSVFPLGMAATMLFVPPLGDRLGRKRVFLVARILECIMYTLVFFTTNYWVMLIAVTGLGLITPGRFNVGTPYLSECFPVKR